MKSCAPACQSRIAPVLVSRLLLAAASAPFCAVAGTWQPLHNQPAFPDIVDPSSSTHLLTRITNADGFAIVLAYGSMGLESITDCVGRVVRLEQRFRDATCGSALRAAPKIGVSRSR